MSPFKDLRVLDFSAGVAGPHAGMLCAQYGAEVVKIEPLTGDWSRELGRRYGDTTAYSHIYNQGKKSLAIDLKNAEAAAVVRTLAQRADVIIEAYRPGVMRRFGLDYDAVNAVNPGVVYLSVTGFGHEGPLANAPATDAVLQGFSGFMHANKDMQGRPQRLDYFIIDVITGLYAFQAIAARLVARFRSMDVGGPIDCSLMRAAAAMQAGKIAEVHFEGGESASYVPLGVFQTADGDVSLSVRRDDHFEALCRALGRDDLLATGQYSTGERRIAHAAELLPILRSEISQRSTQEVKALLVNAGVLHAQVNSYEQMLKSEQVKVIGNFTWLEASGNIPAFPVAGVPGVSEDMAGLSSPGIGENSVEVLQTWGVDPEQISRLQTAGAISS